MSVPCILDNRNKPLLIFVTNAANVNLLVVDGNVWYGKKHVGTDVAMLKVFLEFGPVE